MSFIGGLLGWSATEEPINWQAYRTRPDTRRPENCTTLQHYHHEERSSYNTSEHDGQELDIDHFSTPFMEMKRIVTYEDIEESADTFYRFRLMQKNKQFPPDYESMAIVGFYLTQHDVLILRSTEDFDKRKNALNSFNNDVAGQWTKMQGDLLIFPAPPGNKDYSHLKKTLGDILLSFKYIKEMDCKNRSTYVTESLLKKYDEQSQTFGLNTLGSTKALFKPLFADVRLDIPTKPSETNKVILTLEFLQKTVLIYSKLADLARSCKRYGKALALCRMQRYCCDHMNSIVDKADISIRVYDDADSISVQDTDQGSDLDSSAYTHIVTNWMIGRIMVDFYDLGKEKNDVKSYIDEYFTTLKDLQPMIECIADLGIDKWRNGERRKIEFPKDFPRSLLELMVSARKSYSQIYAPLHFRRMRYQKEFVACKMLVEPFYHLKEKFSFLASNAQPVDSMTAARNLTKVQQYLEGLLNAVDGRRSAVYKEYSKSEYCNDLKSVLSVLTGLAWKLTAMCVASNAFRIGEQLFCVEPPIQDKEAFAYRKMRENFRDAPNNFCTVDQTDSVRILKSTAFRVNVLMKSMREEIMLQIEHERRNPDYNAGVLGIFETLFWVVRVKKLESKVALWKEDLKLSKMMIALFLIGLSTVYLVRYEKESAKSHKDEATKKKRLEELLHNAQYYQRAFTMYMHAYPFVVREVFRMFVEQAELVFNIYRRENAGPLSGIAQTLLSLRRLMPVMSLLWEHNIPQRSHWGPKGYEKIDIASIQLPFHKRFINDTFGKNGHQLDDIKQLLKLPQEHLCLHGDPLYQCSGNFKENTKQMVKDLSDTISRISADNIVTGRNELPIVTAAGRIALMICVAKGKKYRTDSGRRKATFVNELSKSLAFHLFKIWDPILRDIPSPRAYGFLVDRRAKAFETVFAVVCGLLGVYAVEVNWSYLNSIEGVKLLAQELVEVICDSLHGYTAPEENLGGKSASEKIRKFLQVYITCYTPLSLTDSKLFMTSGGFNNVINKFTTDLKKYLQDGKSRDVSFANMVVNTSLLFSYDLDFPDETWRTETKRVANFLAAGLLAEELNFESVVGLELPPMERIVEREDVAENEVVFRDSFTDDNGPNSEPRVDNFPTDIEPFLVREEIDFEERWIMYSDKMFEEVFSCTNNELEGKFTVHKILLQLVNFLQLDLDRHLKINKNIPPCVMFGAVFNESLSIQLIKLRTLLAVPSSNELASLIPLLKVLHKLDGIFFRGSTSMIQRGAIP